MASGQFEYNLTAKEILEKEFKTGLRGYYSEEVDGYLDKIINDYNTYEKEITELKAEIARLMEELNQSPQRVDKEGFQNTPPVQPAGTTNFDILKRLSNLEKHVFGNKLDEK
ncbi:cell division regulator GpsB [Listeria sp. PSOL-1]|uniref:cell division regulator GpsB n=1 Tax=Listeria sp. PSOL-1 TaxID=1844999 RepID=UPI0013D72301|nr:cell division regulator GpsB [Listeria sp. PSOL-1]